MLKLLTAAHADALFHTVDEARPQLVRWFEWPDKITSRESAKAYIEEIQRCSRVHLFWLISENGIPVGGVQLRLRDGGESVSLPYWLVPSAQGRGLATREVSAAMEIAKAIGFWKAKFVIALENVRSRRLAERLGFNPTGGPTESTLRGAPYMVQHFERFL